MPLPTDLPVVDHHCHLSPSGEGVGAARRFAAAGGTHLLLATQNYRGTVPRTIEDYRDQFDTTFRLAESIRTETGVEVRCVVAPYPIDLVHVAPLIGLEPALALHREALDLAGRFVREGRAVALGEVGLPHFPVEEPVRHACESALDHAFSVAREADCPAVVHSADLDGEGYRSLAARAQRAGLPSHRVVKHFARTNVPDADRGGVTPSYLARRELVNDVLDQEGPWFFETDFLDDPARPGAVLDLATIPRRASAIAERGLDAIERLWVPFVRSFEMVYGWRPEVPKRGSA
ncbi:MAG: TatD family hydrolase [Thermoplasmata archaeon]|nr:TatD family hydrolase [Thermoplasmata archaeon]